MQKLTKAEEEVMHLLWKKGRAMVSELIALMPDPQPPHSTISSIMRILEKKGFVDHKAYGRTYEYFPLVTKDEYSRKSLVQFAQDYFGGSVNKMVSFLVQKEDLSLSDLEEIRQMLNKRGS
ncbi:MAG: BlaI/MecI/CopY family transcriptional regulator [Saprospiraceae bacterium]|nr:BlaI/MecI/CopY family transcriptional regulator [Saprospiraceae bacterium]